MLLRALFLTNCLWQTVQADPYLPPAAYDQETLSAEAEFAIAMLDKHAGSLSDTAMPAHTTVLPPAWQSVVEVQAAREGLPPKLVSAVITAESGGNPNAISDKGAVGLMQLLPGTGERFGVPRSERHRPILSILGGTRYLGWLYRHFEGDLRKTVAAYHCGEVCIEKRGLAQAPKVTQRYLSRVLGLLNG